MNDGGGAAKAGALDGGSSSNQAGRPGGPGGGGEGGSAAGGRDAGDSGTGGRGVGAADGSAGVVAGAGGAAGSSGADGECPDDESRYATGCTYAPAPTDGCYASCEDEPCARGECLVVSVPTPVTAGIVAPDAQCGERRPLCVDASLCVAAGHIDWDYVAAVSSSPVLRSRIDGVAGPRGKLRLYDLTGGDAVEVCAVDLPACASAGVDLDDVNRALANPEMQKILRAGGLYGYRGDDGSVLRIVAEASSVEVGEPCDGQSGCRAIDPSVDALATMLRSLTQTALTDARCSGAPTLP